MIKMDIDFKYKIPNLDLSDELVEVGKQFAKDLKSLIDNQLDLNEVPYEPNAESTLKYKAKKGLGSSVLIATGELRKSITSQKVSKNKVVVYIDGGRSLIGDILQNKGVRGGRKFNFFGINTTMEEWATEFMNKRVAEKLNA